MSKAKNMRVEIIDDDHVFIDNKQFVSLGRFADAKKDMAKEVKILVDKNYELAEENEALKIFRLALSQNVGKIVKLAMGLLGIEVPERM